MVLVSDAYTTIPTTFETPLQEKVYQTLQELDMAFQRVETDEVITMEDCQQINERLDMEMVKTLFLCNRQKTNFYLFVTCGDKPFKSKEFSQALEIARVSFASAEQMASMLGTKIGAATIFSGLLKEADKVQLVLDKAVCEQEYYGCSDGTTTGYLKLKTEEVLQKFLPYVKRQPKIIEV
ncbi:prolyl-tRNA synthetase associated domain-containing protein [Candidatus Enterococcus murrayae]|uniref:Prolyl-tRNA synthetase associated domain-containing protein n=1 Tax=Candidatus Enterococcus murrayae TaxID=2815321 RepID=A0ABS3HIW9_9ENTE|nr:YbaK/EbsC family protein [Enterococcus sp. MJM16]MBO0453395.1 prolyl-tRNA synthetase associated domain-containing protein [Enterococcus sp. MJM16]